MINLSSHSQKDVQSQKKGIWQSAPHCTGSTKVNTLYSLGGSAPSCQALPASRSAGPAPSPQGQSRCRMCARGRPCPLRHWLHAEDQASLAGSASWGSTCWSVMHHANAKQTQMLQLLTGAYLHNNPIEHRSSAGDAMHDCWGTAQTHFPFNPEVIQSHACRRGSLPLAGRGLLLGLLCCLGRGCQLGPVSTGECERSVLRGHFFGRAITRHTCITLVARQSSDLDRA